MIHLLSGKTKHYAWGGDDFIYDFLNQDKQNQPCAEYWLGSHPSGISSLEDGTNLDDYLRDNSLELPYLLKILDVKSMLSIQAHPSEAEAKAGYEEELSKNIPIEQRIYKDPYAKPEMCVALDDFYLLSGFRPLQNAIKQILPYPSLSPLLEILQQQGYLALHHHLINCKEAAYKALLLPLIESLEQEQKAGKLKEHHPGYWLLAAYKKYPKDRALLLILFLNLIYLREGQAYYHREGILHAYLSGQCVEIMGNSDNVLRAGLTDKPLHINTIMTCANYEPMDFYTCPVYEKNAYESNFVSNSKVFLLQKITIPEKVFYTSKSSNLEILLFVEGSGYIEDMNEKRTIVVNKGQALLLMPGTSFALHSDKSLALFRALVSPDIS